MVFSPLSLPSENPVAESDPRQPSFKDPAFPLFNHSHTHVIPFLVQLGVGMEDLSCFFCFYQPFYSNSSNLIKELKLSEYKSLGYFFFL